MKFTYYFLFALLMSISFGCNSKQNTPQENGNESDKKTLKDKKTMKSNIKTDTAIFAQGCFWCAEAVFQRLEGVISQKSGYTGGKTKNPTYKEVCTGLTGHAEAIEIIYDPTKITYEDLLKVFWETHDPTTLNRQGNDAGTQYRSAVYYMNEEQHKIAEAYKIQLNQSGVYKDPIVTEITKADVFYPAEDYHDDYFNQNGSQPYCQFVIRPKIDKFEHKFKDKLKK